MSGSKVTKESPKQAGYFWHKNEYGLAWDIVEVWQNDQGYWMAGVQLIDEHYIENFATDETVWCGPISEPPNE